MMSQIVVTQLRKRKEYPDRIEIVISREFAARLNAYLDEHNYFGDNDVADLSTGLEKAIKPE